MSLQRSLFKMERSLPAVIGLAKWKYFINPEKKSVEVTIGEKPGSALKLDGLLSSHA